MVLDLVTALSLTFGSASEFRWAGYWDLGNVDYVLFLEPPTQNSAAAPVDSGETVPAVYLKFCDRQKTLAEKKCMEVSPDENQHLPIDSHGCFVVQEGLLCEVLSPYPYRVQIRALGVDRILYSYQGITGSGIEEGHRLVFQQGGDVIHDSP